MKTIVGAEEPQEPKFNYEQAAATYRGKHRAEMSRVAVVMAAAGTLTRRSR